ncbi:hypothetical protein AB7M56_007058 [Bradyrhizobium elkanii]|nr:hypothetical protein [Bradyrhizobium elkanii]MCS4067889.1 hypothetical protein [Bradyrhizobium elkanii]MCS4083425.1 hypothetical protein [Bradyrhizobium elkanii]MCW2126948.1 hypothetical protein [Bradyrhizobium elkanii]MCW2173695.1 hypothetical protein [Bradyrhizobium elkanii]
MVRPPGDKIKIYRIYNRAAYWSERVRLIQYWSDASTQLARRCAGTLAKKWWQCLPKARIRDRGV